MSVGPRDFEVEGSSPGEIGGNRSGLYMWGNTLLAKKAKVCQDFFDNFLTTNRHEWRGRNLWLLCRGSRVGCNNLDFSRRYACHCSLNSQAACLPLQFGFAGDTSASRTDSSRGEPAATVTHRGDTPATIGSLARDSLFRKQYGNEGLGVSMTYRDCYGPVGA
jgi:hypothetical protein